MDFQDYEGNGSVCPSCLDNELEVSEQPVWATDQGEVYEVICPYCGVVDTWSEFVNNEDADFWMFFAAPPIEFEAITKVA